MEKDEGGINMQSPSKDQKLKYSPANEKDSKVNSIREKITSMITYFMAARIIAESDFPKKHELPEIYPSAFNNFGHQSLFDYKLLLSIIWQVIEDIKSSIRNWKDKKRPWIICSVITGVVLLFLGIAGESAIIIIAALILPFIIYGIGASKVNSSMRKDIAGIRAKSIEQLINGEWKSKGNSVNKTIENELIRIGDGALDGDKIPVITILNNEHPFPGYGRLQAENLFICRPKEKKFRELPTIDEIHKIVSKNITDKVLSSGIKETTFGDLIAIHGDSLLIDSKWLDEEKVPILWLDKSALENVHMIDPKASTRIYFATQVLFPKYMTAATFFVRLFWAGNSASCQIAVSTLGPLTVDRVYFLTRLLKHKREKEKAKIGVSASPATSLNEEERTAIDELRLLRILSESIPEFQSDLININDIEKLEISDFKKAHGDEYKKEYKKIIKESVSWPGYFTSSQNLRETNSYTFTTDFFGRPEAIASVRTLYDQISRAVLDSLDTLGFDISDYRDKEGKYSINADKIDQIVVGEKIHIEKSKESKKSEVSTPPSDKIKIESA